MLHSEQDRSYVLKWVCIGYRAVRYFIAMRIILLRNAHFLHSAAWWFRWLRIMPHGFSQQQGVHNSSYTFWCIRIDMNDFNYWIRGSLTPEIVYTAMLNMMRLFHFSSSDLHNTNNQTDLKHSWFIARSRRKIINNLKSLAEKLILYEWKLNAYLKVEDRSTEEQNDEDLRCLNVYYVMHSYSHCLCDD